MIDTVEIKKFDNCICVKQREVIELFNLNKEYIGTLEGTNATEDWKLIKAGHNPIDEYWERRGPAFGAD